MTSSRAALTFVLLTVFIDSLGFGIIIPSMPSVIMELTGEPISAAADWGGYLMAVYALLQFFMAPIFGNLSDRIGRRPVLLASLAAFGVDFLLTGLAPNMSWLFIGRAVAGVFGASYAAAAAYIGDISGDENRAKNFGLIGAAWGSGFTLGPVIGGFFADHFDPRAPFFVAAALALANVVFGIFALPESLPRERRRRFEWVRANPFGAFKSLAHLPMVAGLLVAVFLYQIAHDSLPAVWMYYTQLKFDWSLSEMGMSLTFVGIMTVIVMGGLTGVVVPQLGERRAILVGFSLMTLGFLGYALATRGWMIYLALAIGSLGGIASPSVQSVMSKRAGPSAQGELQGAVASLSSIAAVLSPLFMTQLFSHFSAPDAGVHFPGAPYLVSAALVLLCVLICARAVVVVPSRENADAPRA
ncbi:MAG TPA: TCR/Tet family MFS transporter [Steroidobacteraceae bacterium]|nr:TCR/Tet family MFS transporter [Steroidobacteraceae bacterium]